MTRPLPPGLYDAPVSAGLDRALAALRRDAYELAKVDPHRMGALLARVLQDRVAHTLAGLDADHQLRVANELLELLSRVDPRRAAVTPDDRITRAGTALAAVLEGELPARPAIPLSSSELLVNGRHDVRIGSEINLELASADRVDLLCSFLKWSGFRVLEGALAAFLRRRPGALRVLTTAYMGATERRALDALVEMGATVRVSYDVERTRLHAKAWLFHRDSGFSTGFIGSSNLSHAAMLEGLEWNVRLAQADNAPILEKFRAVFDQYWFEGDFEPYDPVRDRERWDRTVQRQAADRNRLLLSIRIEPKPHQVEILDSLAAERERGHHRNLVVAATGTGKTIVAALDYQRIAKQLGRASLLFVAHRKEILDQSMLLFQVVLANATFGERLGDGEVPRAGEHVFANVQSLDSERLASLAPDAYDVIIVDEFHHAAAKTYADLLDHFRPKILLGLTATPERADGKSVLGWFDGRVAAELRLWKALDQGLLSPFQYFGASDGTTLAGVAWTPRGYDRTQLRNVYAAGDFWVKRVLQEVNRRVADPMRMRALGFCVDIDHAELMAERFTSAGLESRAVSQRTGAAERRAALEGLRAGDIRVVFSVDLFNEGVDLPDVDTLLFLRPTESPTVFLQQLGRGLRRAEGKDCLTVLDFIGVQHRRFRFDARFRALLGGTRRQIQREVELGFPRLPPGCSIQLDPVAQRHVLDNIRDALRLGETALVEDLRALGDLPLDAFLREAGVELEEVYARPGKCFTALRRKAGFAADRPDGAALGISRALARMLHVDDPDRLQAFRAFLSRPSPPPGDPSDRFQRMLFVLLGWMREPLSALDRAWRELWAAADERRELLELIEVLDDQRGLTHPGGVLRVHAAYALDEVMAAIDERDRNGGVRRLREGVYFSAKNRMDLLFVTLEKVEEDYSPTTLYRDFPISPRRFHWESQSFVHADTKTGRRYIEHERSGHSILLFVRQRRELRPGITEPYRFLGPVRYLRHEGARPMAIEWELDRDMPAALYQETKVAAG